MELEPGKRYMMNPFVVHLCNIHCLLCLHHPLVLCVFLPIIELISFFTLGFSYVTLADIESVYEPLLRPMAISPKKFP